MHLQKEWHASEQIKNAFAFLHFSLTTWDGEQELMTMQERFPSLWLNKGSACNKNVDEPIKNFSLKVDAQKSSRCDFVWKT